MTKTNYEMFIETVNTLKSSQGFYSRLANNLNDMSVGELADLESHLNSLPKFKDTLDVIFYLES